MEDRRMEKFVCTISNQFSEMLSSLRHIEGLQVAVEGDTIWVMGTQSSFASQPALKQMPFQSVYLLGHGDQLFLPEGLTPVAVLPNLPWLPIQQFVSVDRTTSAMPGVAERRVDVSLMRTDREEKVAAVRIPLALWREYGESAPAARLERLRFAVSEDGEVLVVGDLPPSLPGESLWFCRGVYLPCGWRFEIDIAADLLRGAVNRDELIVFYEGGEWQSIPQHFFVPARRSAIRLTNPPEPKNKTK